MEMNDSHRYINQEIKEILLKNKNRERAFDGTVLQGNERQYTIINHKDLKKYIDVFSQNELAATLDSILGDIEHGREKDGKKPFNSYLVVNTDEPYAEEIVEILKRYGHWD